MSDASIDPRQMYLGLALGLLDIIRGAWQRGHPDQPVPEELTDAYLVAKLDADSDTLLAHVERLKAKYGPDGEDPLPSPELPGQTGQ